MSIGITVLGSALMAKLVDMTYVDESQIGYGIMVMLIMASFSGAMSAAGRIKRRRLIVCATSGLLYIGILLSITALFFGGQYEAVCVTCILVMGGAMLAVLAEGQGRRGRKHRKIKMKNC